MLQSHFQAMENAYLKEIPIKELTELSPTIGGIIFTFDFACTGNTPQLPLLSILGFDHPVYINSGN